MSHSVVIDGLLRGLRMPGDGPVGLAVGFVRGNLGIKSGQSHHQVSELVLIDR